MDSRLNKSMDRDYRWKYVGMFHAGTATSVYLNASYKLPYILKLGSVLVALAGDIMVPCVSPASKGRSELP